MFYREMELRFVFLSYRIGKSPTWERYWGKAIKVKENNVYKASTKTHKGFTLQNIHWYSVILSAILLLYPLYYNINSLGSIHSPFNQGKYDISENIYSLNKFILIIKD